MAAKLIIEDHMKAMVAKSQNVNYKPWKNAYAPKNPHSPFGDFPKEFKLNPAKKEDRKPEHEISQASTTTKFTTFKGTGIGGRATST